MTAHTVDESPAETSHATCDNVWYKDCHCMQCIAMRKAVNRLVDGFSTIPGSLADRVLPEDLAGRPMWSTIFIVLNDTDASRIRSMLTTPEEGDGLEGSDWQCVGDTGIYATEVEGELILGIDGAGYSFHAEHWQPLYEALNYHWHN